METTPNTELTPQPRRRDAKREFLRRLQTDFPDASPGEIAARFVEHCRDSDPIEVEDIVWSALEEWALANIPPARTPRKPRARIDPEAEGQVEAQIKAKDDERIEAEVTIRLLDFVTPNGKRLADCTGAQCRKLGGFFAEVAKRLQPRDHVGEHLHEDELQSIARTYRIIAGSRS
jgi:hypothetical protein